MLVTPIRFPFRSAGRFDLRANHQIGLHVVGEGGEDLDIEPAHRSAQGRRAAGIAKLQIAGIQRRDQSRRTGNENRLNVDAVLGEEASFLSHP